MLESFFEAYNKMIKSPQIRINTGVLRRFVLFPLDGAGGFGGYIVNYAVYVFYLVCDTI